MLIYPNAKINLGLNVVNRRADGYHNIETIFYPVKIQDALEVIASDELQFTTSGIEIPGYANENLCLKAYGLLSKDFALPPVHIHLHKNIPIGAGLGGGSADAACFIKIMNEQFALRLSTEQMEDYSRRLGADCAFFVRNEPVFAKGIGDEFEPVNFSLTNYHLALVMPPVHVSTPEAYRGVKPMVPGKSLKDIVLLPVDQWKFYMKNDFEEGVFKNHYIIRGVKAALYEAGALFALMSGSGASVYGIFPSKPDLTHLEQHNQVFYDL